MLFFLSLRALRYLSQNRFFLFFREAFIRIDVLIEAECVLPLLEPGGAVSAQFPAFEAVASEPGSQAELLNGFLPELPVHKCRSIVVELDGIGCVKTFFGSVLHSALAIEAVKH